MKTYRIYILASAKNGTIYIGVTSDIYKRIQQHKEGNIQGFTQKYGVKYLVYVESVGNVMDAIQREKQLKGRKRQRKISLIEKDNPEWIDLSMQW